MSVLVGGRVLRTVVAAALADVRAIASRRLIGAAGVVLNARQSHRAGREITAVRSTRVNFVKAEAAVGMRDAQTGTDALPCVRA
jgi:hypothetical protein